MRKKLSVAAFLAVSVGAAPAFAQHDPGVRGGLLNTAGMLQFRGIPIPHPPGNQPEPDDRRHHQRQRIEFV